MFLERIVVEIKGLFNKDERRVREERFKAIATNTPDHVLIQDRELRYTWVLNPQMGLKVEDMLGRTDHDVLSPDDAEKLARIKREVIESGKAVRMTVPLVSVNGATEYFDGAYVPKYDAKGNVDGLIGYFRNVTDRVRAEEEMKKSEARYRDLFLAMVNGSALHEIVLDDRGVPCDYRFLAVNAAFEQLTGLKSADIVGRTVLEIAPQTERHWIETYGRVALTGEPCHFEQFWGFQGKYYEVNAYSPQKGQFVCVFADITGRKQSEEVLKKAKEDAELASQAKSEFLSSISHDFRTPMHAIMGFSSFLQSEQLTVKQKKFADMINACSKNLFGLLDQILEVSRLESGRVQLRLMVFDLKECAETAFRSVETGKKDNVRMTCSIDDGIPMLMGEPVRLGQVLSNLLSNAVKFTDDGEISLTVNQDKDACVPGKCRVRFAVKDTGMGIAEGALVRIFDPFTQFHELETGKGGAGLGLYIAKTLVEMMHGEIRVTSMVGQGSEFVVTLDFDIV
ncbi:MAG: PAS domain-containing protein [Candidatus Omnitrophica bacterium]|nr:PAS domain-containing protein [Candidatus Omnitrophota bacterium]